MRSRSAIAVVLSLLAVVAPLGCKGVGGKKKKFAIKEIGDATPVDFLQHENMPKDRYSGEEYDDDEKDMPEEVFGEAVLGEYVLPDDLDLGYIFVIAKFPSGKVINFTCEIVEKKKPLQSETYHYRIYILSIMKETETAPICEAKRKPEGQGALVFELHKKKLKGYSISRVSEVGRTVLRVSKKGQEVFTIRDANYDGNPGVLMLGDTVKPLMVKEEEKQKPSYIKALNTFETLKKQQVDFVLVPTFVLRKVATKKKTYYPRVPCHKPTEIDWYALPRQTEELSNAAEEVKAAKPKATFTLYFLKGILRAKLPAYCFITGENTGKISVAVMGDLKPTEEEWDLVKLEGQFGKRERLDQLEWLTPKAEGLLKWRYSNQQASGKEKNSVRRKNSVKH